MDADLDLMLTAVYVTADDLLPEGVKNAKRSVTDAEVVTLCVAHAIMGITVAKALCGDPPRSAWLTIVAGEHMANILDGKPGESPGSARG